MSLDRRALLGEVTHHFNQEQGLLGGVDAKGFDTCEIQSNLQIVLGEGKRLLLVPVDSLQNKACTSIIYLCSFFLFKSGYLGPIDPSSKFSGHFATGARVRGTGEVGYLSVTTQVFGPKPASIQAPEGSW